MSDYKFEVAKEFSRGFCVHCGESNAPGVIDGICCECWETLMEKD